MTGNSITARSRSSEDRSAPADDEQLPREMRIRRLKLYRAALNADWDIAKGIFDEYEDDISVEISKQGDTALHIAAAAEHTDFVKQLVERMSAEDLVKKNKVGNTAFFLAAASRKVELAEVMMNKNEDLAMIGDGNLLPIHIAASLGHRHMVNFLYEKTKDKLEDNRIETKDKLEDNRNETEDKLKDNLFELLFTLINTNLYDVALKVLGDYTDLATAHDGEIGTALHALARKHLTSSNFANQNKRGILSR